MSEETKTVDVQVEEETKTVSLQEFLNKSFECLKKEEFKKQEERKAELEEKIDLLEKNIKEGFLHYTREIMKGLDDANQVIVDIIAPPLDQIPPPQLARRSSPVSVVEI